MVDVYSEIAALLHPMPFPSPDEDEDDQRLRLIRQVVEPQRQATAARLRQLWDDADRDPLLEAIEEQHRVRAEAEQRIRQLVAYGREFVTPRPYPREILAPSLGGSPSAVRGAYDHRDVEQVAEILGRRSTVARTPATAAELTELLADLADRSKTEAAAGQVPAVAAALREHGWTPYAPVTRTANKKFAKHYVRWEKRWPNGTVVALYQEPDGWLGVYAKMPENDPRWFSERYGIDDPHDGQPVTASDIYDALTIYDARITRHDDARAEKAGSAV